MDKIEQLKQQKQYEAYVKKKTPQHNVWFNMMKAFFLGGTICLIGQCIYHFCELKKLSPDDCSSWTSILLILLSILLTGTGDPVWNCDKLGAWNCILGMDVDVKQEMC